MFVIVDPNRPPEKQEVASTPYSDVAEIVARAIFEHLYGGQLSTELAQRGRRARPFLVRGDGGERFDVGWVQETRRVVGRIG